MLPGRPRQDAASTCRSGILPLSQFAGALHWDLKATASAVKLGNALIHRPVARLILPGRSRCGRMPHLRCELYRCSTALYDELNDKSEFIVHSRLRLAGRSGRTGDRRTATAP